MKYFAKSKSFACIFYNRKFTWYKLRLLFNQGVQLVHGLKARMKNKLMPMWDKIMLGKDISSNALMKF